jgi:hypothetical protein
MEQSNYIYIQLAEKIHEDQPRILTASDNNNLTIYISDLTTDEQAILNSLIDLINKRLNS